MSSVAASSPAAAAAATSSVAAAAASSVRSTTTAAAATSTSAAAAATSAASSAAASSAAAASSSTSVAASSVAASSVPASSSSSTSSSTLSTSSSTSSATSSTSAASIIAGAASASASSGNKGLSGGAIGGIAGGAAGGVVLLVLIFLLWRWRRDRKDRVPPPPPRDMSVNPNSIHRHTTSMMQGHTGGTSGINRASSYSTLLANGRPSSQWNSHSRHPSFYASYPIATPSSGSHDNSPPMPPASYPTAAGPPVSSSSENASSSSGASPPLSALGSGRTTPLHKKPSLAPIDTSSGLRRDDSSSSGEGRQHMRHTSSVDRLRQEAGMTADGRAPSPSETGSSRATSPHPFPSSHSRNSLPASPYGGRPVSMASLGSSRYMHHPSHAPSFGGAPHQRGVALRMPEKLGARPDRNGDFFPDWSAGRGGETWSAGEHPRQGNRAYGESDYTPSPSHMRFPSGSGSIPVRRPPGLDPALVLDRGSDDNV